MLHHGKIIGKIFIYFYSPNIETQLNYFIFHLHHQFLSQQEIDQKQSWWQKVKISVNLQLSIQKKSNENENKKGLEREPDSYFYSS